MQIAVGDVIAAGITEKTPYGLLRKVEAKQVSGGVVRFQTRQARVTEAIQRATVHFANVPVTLRGVSVSRAGMPLVADPEVTFEMESPDIAFASHIKGSAKVSFTLTLSGDLQIEDHDLKVLAFTASLREEYTLTLKAVAEQDLFELELLLKRWPANPVILVIGPVVIPLWPSVEMWAIASGKVSGELAATGGGSITTTAGFRYENGSLSPIWSYVPAWVGELQGTAQGSLEGLLGPRISITPFFPPEVLDLLELEASAGVQVSGFLGPTVRYFSDPWWELACGVKATAHVDLVLWGFVPFERTFELATLYSLCLKGESELILTAAAPVIDVGGTTDLSAVVRDAGGTIPLPLVPLFRTITWTSRRPEIATVSALLTPSFNTIPFKVISGGASAASGQRVRGRWRWSVGPLGAGRSPSSVSA
jgi:hypothetical protein